jgi:hypothetical protein
LNKATKYITSTRCVGSLKFEKFEFEDKLLQKSKIAGKKLEKNTNKISAKSHSLFEKSIIWGINQHIDG